MNEEKSKKKSKDYADAKRKVKESEIKVGDTVICTQNKQNKFSTKFEANPYTVVTIKGDLKRKFLLIQINGTVE